MTAVDLPEGVSPLLTTVQAATYLAISPSSLETYRTRGGGPVATKVGRSVRYRLSDLDAWTVREERTPVPEVRRSNRAGKSAALRSVS